MVSPRSDVNTGQPSCRTRPHTNHRLAVPASGNLQQSNTLDSVALADDGPDQTFPACLLFTSGCHQRPTDWWHPIKNQNHDQNSDTRLMTSWSRHYQQDGIGHQRCQSGTLDREVVDGVASCPLVEDHLITTLSETHTIHSPSSGKLLSCVKLLIFKIHFDIPPLSRNKSGSNFLRPPNPGIILPPVAGACQSA